MQFYWWDSWRHESEGRFLDMSWLLQKTNDDDHDDKEEEIYRTNDPIQKQKFDTNRPTMFLNDYPEVDVKHSVTYSNKDSGFSCSSSNAPIQMAPGEGKIPTNILQESSHSHVFIQMANTAYMIKTDKFLSVCNRDGSLCDYRLILKNIFSLVFTGAC